MSTRSVVAFPEGDLFKGRHIHCDGYPTYMAHTLWTLVQRDGLETVLRVLTEEHYSWSHLSAREPSIKDVKPPSSYEEACEFGYQSPKYEAFMLSPGGMYGDGRFVNVPGYGVAHTTAQGQSRPDDWIYSNSADDWWTEWAYVLHIFGMAIFKRLGDRWDFVCPVRWAAPEPDWKVIETMVTAP